jgi:iron-sulfur cluster repair protein YtfE (RIC family)
MPANRHEVPFRLRRSQLRRLAIYHLNTQKFVIRIVFLTTYFCSHPAHFHAESASMLSDPVQAFEHDHVRCSTLVRALGERMEMLRRKPFSRRQLISLIEQLRDELFLHFAREEEALFPLIVHQLPHARKTVDRLIATHDAICGTLSRLLLLASQPGSDASFASFEKLLKRFNTFYAEHATTEVTLLREVDEHLDARQREELRELTQGL